ncbi:MAG: hypothetical protein ABSB33_01970 [Tepidisphaeraceae bacterium]|jgi:hypothetical protein
MLQEQRRHSAMPDRREIQIGLALGKLIDQSKQRAAKKYCKSNRPGYTDQRQWITSQNWLGAHVEAANL